MSQSACNWMRLIRENTETIVQQGAEVPLVSVSLIAYNHAEYIERAIDSVLMQKTSFPVAIVIGEDFSADGTRDIVRRCQKENPQRVHLLMSSRNLGEYSNGGILNAMRNLRACKGKYIARLDGDDYWTDPLKLQKQVDFLEAHPECSICSTNQMIVDRDGKVLKDKRHAPEEQPPTIYDLDRLLNPYPGLGTASVMFRRDCVDSMPEIIYKVFYGDWVLFLTCALRGKLGYLPEVMMARRLHPGGIHTSLGRFERQLIEIRDFKVFLEHYDNPVIQDYFTRELARAERELKGGYIAYAQELMPAKKRAAIIDMLKESGIPPSWVRDVLYLAYERSLYKHYWVADYNNSLAWWIRLLCSFPFKTLGDRHLLRLGWDSLRGSRQ